MNSEFLRKLIEVDDPHWIKFFKNRYNKFSEYKSSVIFLDDFFKNDYVLCLKDDNSMEQILVERHLNVTIFPKITKRVLAEDYITDIYQKIGFGNVLIELKNNVFHSKLPVFLEYEDLKNYRTERKKSDSKL